MLDSNLLAENYFDKILKPYSKKNIVGNDISESDIYFKLQEAYRSDTDTDNLGIWQRSLKSVEWDNVEKFATEILETQSKDLWVFMLLMEFIIEKKGMANFLKSIKYMNIFIQKFGEKFYPVKIEKRTNLIDWFFKKINVYFKRCFGIEEKSSELLIVVHENFESICDLKQLLQNAGIITSKFENFFDFVKSLDDKYIKTLQFKQENVKVSMVNEAPLVVENNNQNNEQSNIHTVEAAYAQLANIKDFLEAHEPRNITYMILDLIPILRNYTVKDLIQYGNEQDSLMFYISKIICKSSK